MLNLHIIATVNQKILSFLAKFSDKEFYERQIARKIGISYGSANRALNDLYSTGAIKRRRKCVFTLSIPLAQPLSNLRNW